MLRGRILIAEDDALFSDVLVDALSEEFDIVAISALNDLWTIQRRFDVVLMDDHLRDGWTTDHLEAIAQATGGARLVLCTAGARTESADIAIQHGIQSFLVKPVTVDEVRLALRRALEAARLTTRLAVKERTTSTPDDGLSPEVAELLQRAAKGSATILLGGETGVGKTHVAKRIHQWSPRRVGPFMHVNCAAVPESLADVEFFGAERGAYTGAVQARPGAFELASGGTLFLDEIADLPLALQGKILTVLEEQTLRRVGGTVSRPIDVRLIAATNRNLRERVAEGRFREDLLYRLEVLPVRIAALRETPTRIPGLIADLLRRLAPGAALTLAPGELERLMAHAWPGNVRELRNVLERALTLDAPNKLQPSRHVFNATRPASIEATPPPAPNLGQTLREVELRHILATLASTKGNKHAAARMLGISVTTLRRWLESQAVS